MYQIKKYDYTPILGWSLTRYDLFQTCRRRYFYTYYAKHDTQYPPDKIRFLKEMVSFPLAVGNISHEVIRALLDRLLKAEKEIDRERFFDFVRGHVREYCTGNTFREVYYGEKTETDVSGIEDEVKLCLENFLNSTRMAWLLGEAIGTKGDWILEPPGYGESRVDGLKAYFKVDFLFPVGKRTYIIDWKTGRPHEEKHRKQLLGYTAWACSHLHINPDLVTAVAAYLKPGYEEREYEFSERDIREFVVLIKRETAGMYEYCTDVEENIPKEKGAFEKTDNLETCKLCNFRELCF